MRPVGPRQQVRPLFINTYGYVCTHASVSVFSFSFLEKGQEKKRKKIITFFFSPYIYALEEH